MGNVIEERRQFSDNRFAELKRSLVDAPKICSDNACVYATGSFGRREANAHSDIDLFIASLSDFDNERKIDRSRLTKLQEILLKADLIRASRILKFPEFSQDGRFLQHHTARKLIQSTGNQYDDAENTFTARLLLLLESRPLTGDEVYSQIINEVVAKYWAEYPRHIDCFVPAYLANDILRYWRTLCLNYEANTSIKTPVDRAKRKIKNYKLKHSRMLTCYSALLQLLFVYDRTGSVSVTDAQTMISFTPTQRVEFVAKELHGDEPVSDIEELIAKYERFLDVTSVSEDDLVEAFLDEDSAQKLRDEQSDFGDVAYRILYSIGHNNQFYRRLVI